MRYLIAVVILMSLSACGKDVSYITGATGATGNRGPAGEVGPSGTPGSNAMSWTPVQFCKGTTHYPDTFCEVGYCYEGNIYATYSANDGFSSETPSGIYASNGINCSCTFTISANCAVGN